MSKIRWMGFILVGLLAGCSTIENLGKDTTPPEIRLTVLNGMGRPVFSTSEGSERPADACAYVRSYPVRIAVAVSDLEGVTLVSARIFPVTAIETTIATVPTGPDATIQYEQEGFGDKITVLVKQPPDDVHSNVLLTIDLLEDEPTKIFLRAKDVNDNASELYQVDTRPIRDTAACRDGLS